MPRPESNQEDLRPNLEPKAPEEEKKNRVDLSKFHLGERKEIKSVVLDSKTNELKIMESEFTKQNVRQPKASEDFESRIRERREKYQKE